MPIHNPRRPRRRRPLRRRKNPDRRTVLLAVGAVAAAGAVGYGGYRLSKALRSTSPPPLGPSQGGGGPVLCEIGPNYPGFVRDGSGVCSPTDATPPGIYVDATCDDFTFVKGAKDNDGEQAARLDSMIETARVASLEPDAKSADPTDVVTQFLRMTWPQCTWPPSATSPPRIAQLFNALSLLVGRLIVHNGGRVLGTSAEDLVDEQVAERLAELELPVYDPELVPEIKLPVFPIIVFPTFPTDPPGPDIDEPAPGGGLIELPPGGQQIPSQGGDDELPECAILAQIRTVTRVLPPTNFVTKRVETFKIWSPTSGECKRYEVAFGVCLQASSHFGYLDAYVSDNKPADVGEVFFRIRQSNGSGIDWAMFETPVRYKAQFRTSIRVNPNGSITIVSNPKIAEIDNKDLDPCSSKSGRWPIPEQQTYEVRATDGDWKYWEPVPRFAVLEQGSNLMLRVTYFGLPYFDRYDEDVAEHFPDLADALGPPQGIEGIARIGWKTAQNLTVKVWSGGKE